MNIGKSIKVACAINDTTQTKLARTIGVTPEYLSSVVTKKGFSAKLLANLAGAFDMPVSEFIALGEG